MNMQEPEKKKNIRSTQAQIHALVNYMSSHCEFARGDFSGPLGSQRLEAEWDKLKALLSNLGPDKSTEQWKNTWRDLKKKARIDTAIYNKAKNSTGNTAMVPVLSDITNKIMRGNSETVVEAVASTTSTPSAMATPVRPPQTMSSVPSAAVSPAIGPPNRKKKRRQSRPIIEFAKIQKESNDVLQTFADDVVTLVKEHNEQQKRFADKMLAALEEHMQQEKRNSDNIVNVLKERNDIEKERNAILRFSSKRK